MITCCQVMQQLWVHQNGPVCMGRVLEITCKEHPGCNVLHFTVLPGFRAHQKLPSLWIRQPTPPAYKHGGQGRRSLASRSGHGLSPSPGSVKLAWVIQNWVKFKIWKGSQNLCKMPTSWLAAASPLLAAGSPRPPPHVASSTGCPAQPLPPPQIPLANAPQGTLLPVSTDLC